MDKANIYLPFNSEWLAQVQAFYSLSAGIQLPPIESASLHYLNSNLTPEYKRDGGLVLATEPYFTQYEYTAKVPTVLHLQANAKGALRGGMLYRLLLWFTPSDGLPDYTNEPWQIDLKPTPAGDELVASERFPFGVIKTSAFWQLGLPPATITEQDRPKLA